MSNISLGLIIAVFGGLIALVKDWKSNRESNAFKHNFLGVVAFLLLCIGAGYAYSAGKTEIAEKNEANKKLKTNDSIAKLYRDSFQTSQSQLLNLSLHQLDTAHKIISLSDSLIAAQSELYKFETGGDNIPLCQIYGYEKNKGYYTMFFKVFNKGKYPLEGVKFGIEDYTRGVYAYTTNGQGQITYFGGTSDVTKGFDWQPPVGIIAPGSSANVYETTILKNFPELFRFYSIRVEWKRGFYWMIVDLKPDESSQGLRVFAYIRNSLDFKGRKNQIRLVDPGLLKKKLPNNE